MLISNGDQVLTKRVYNSDETVLWEGAWTPGNGSSLTNATITLSESMSNFESIEIVTGAKISGVHRFWYDSTHPEQRLYIATPDGDVNSLISALQITWDDATTLRFRCGYGDNYATAFRSNVDWGYFQLLKVVGINRKEGN